jgi:hypothetical protein
VTSGQCIVPVRVLLVMTQKPSDGSERRLSTETKNAHYDEQGRQNVDRIAREFSWSCFPPVVVFPVEGGKFAIIDGQHRTTSAAIVGYETVPCQIVIAAKEKQAAAFKAINGTTTPISIMALHAAARVAGRQTRTRLCWDSNQSLLAARNSDRKGFGAPGD